MSSNAADYSFTNLLYHFINNDNGVPIYPYVSAVTGHRSFAQPGEAEGIPGFTEEDIKKAFKSQLQPMAELWRKCCKGTAPFVLLTGMADGADQIAAEAAMELSPDLNIKIVAVLPMPEDLFINTIENKERFNRLLQRASYQFSMPLTANNVGHESELANICSETEFRRQEQYALQDHFLALHSHVLFALWDGVPSTQNKGGTADAVFFKLNGNTESQKQGDLLTFSSVGPVVHLLIPRNNQDNRDYPLAPDLDMSSIPVFYLTRNVLRGKFDLEATASADFRKNLLNSEIRCNSTVAEIPEVKSILEKIGNLNTDSVACFKQKSFIDKCVSSYQDLYNLSDKPSSGLENNLFRNNSDNLNDLEDANTRLLTEHYAVADQIAIKFQKKTLGIIFCYTVIFCLFLFSSSFQATLYCMRIFGWGNSLESFYHFIWTCGSEPSKFQFLCLPILTILYLISVFLLVGIFYYAKKQKFHYRYHRFRALAEALRIQIFWRIAGMSDCVSGYYRSHQIPETEWIRAAINGLDVFLASPDAADFSASQEERIRFTINNWVEGQRSYYSSKANKRNREQKGIASFFFHPYFLTFLIILYFFRPFKFDLFRYLTSLNPGPIVHDIWLHLYVALHLLMFTVTLTTIMCAMYLKFNRTKIEAKRFKQILFPFDRAAILLDAPRDSDEQQLILRQLGTEAISENVSWLLTVGEQDLTLPR